jgi:NADH-quinone oxidoreductase subunit C
MEIAKRLQAQFPDEILDVYEYQGQVAVVAAGVKIVDILQYLRDDSEIQCNHLLSLCAVDNKKRMSSILLRFEVVYNLYSISKRHTIRVRAQVPEADHSIDSVTSLWSGADWHERECYDLMGITFNGHPDMRRILLPDDWDGHPLRKEYPLKGREEWTGMTELLKKTEELRQYSFGFEKKPEKTTISSESSEQSDNQGNDKA